MVLVWWLPHYHASSMGYTDMVWTDPPPPDIHHQVCTLHYLRQMAKQFWCLCDCSLKWAGLLSVIASFRVTTRGCGGEQRWDVFILVCTAVTHDHSCDCSVVRQILSGVSHWSHMVLCHSNGILLIVCLSAKCNWTRNAETTVQNLPLCKAQLTPMQTLHAHGTVYCRSHLLVIHLSHAAIKGSGIDVQIRALLSVNYYNYRECLVT